MELLLSGLVGAGAFGIGFFCCHVKDQALIQHLTSHVRDLQKLKRQTEGHQETLKTLSMELNKTRQTLNEVADQVAPVVEQYEQTVTAIEQLQEQAKKRLPPSHPWRLGELSPVTPLDQQEYARIMSRSESEDDDYTE